MAGLVATGGPRLPHLRVCRGGILSGARHEGSVILLGRAYRLAGTGRSGGTAREWWKDAYHISVPKRGLAGNGVDAVDQNHARKLVRDAQRTDELLSRHGADQCDPGAAVHGATRQIAGERGEQMELDLNWG
jgi:hypothetical protein